MNFFDIFLIVALCVVVFALPLAAFIDQSFDIDLKDEDINPYNKRGLK